MVNLIPSRWQENSIYRPVLVASTVFSARLRPTYSERAWIKRSLRFVCGVTVVKHRFMRRNVPPQRFPRRYAASIYARLTAGEQCRETLFNDLEPFPRAVRSTTVAVNIIDNDNYHLHRSILSRVTPRSAIALARSRRSSVITAYSPCNDDDNCWESHKLARGDWRRKSYLLNNSSRTLQSSAVRIILHSRVRRRARAKRARYTIPRAIVVDLRSLFSDVRLFSPPGIHIGFNSVSRSIVRSRFSSFIFFLPSLLCMCTNRFPLALCQALERELVESFGPCSKHEDPAIMKVYRYGPRDLGYRVNFSISRRQIDGCETPVSN